MNLYTVHQKQKSHNRSNRSQLNAKINCHHSDMICVCSTWIQQEAQLSQRDHAARWVN